jgi:hypothetical protein
MVLTRCLFKNIYASQKSAVFALRLQIRKTQEANCIASSLATRTMRQGDGRSMYLAKLTWFCGTNGSVPDVY